MANQGLPGGQTAPPNINSLAAQGIQGAGMGTALGMGYTPSQVGVAGQSATVNPSGLSPTVTPNQLATTNLAPYMNPYTSQVIDAQQADILRGANIGLDQLGTQAQHANAFGGSRHGIAMSEMGRGVADMMGQQSASLRQAGYENAQQAAMQDIQNNMQGQLANQAGGQFDISTGMQGQQLNQQAGLQDISNQLQASLANQTAGLQGQQQRLGAANQLGQLSNLGFGMGQQVNRNLSQQGAQQQALQQALFDAAQQQYQGFVNHPAQGLGYLTSALNAAPINTPNTVTQTKTPGLFDYLTLGANAYTGNPN